MVVTITESTAVGRQGLDTHVSSRPMTGPSRCQQILFSLLSIVVAWAGCASTAGRQVETGLARALISSQEENQIGLQVKNELETKQGVRYLDDPVVVDYVRVVAGKMIASGQRERSDVQWQVNVIDDNKTVNAFATPGGFLYVYSGLLAAADNEAQLAGVMAHETGHVVARHAARNLITAYGLEAAAALAAGNNPGLLRQLATSVAANGLFLAHSRADETEADEYGARYLSAGGYDPNGIIQFFRTLQAKQGQMPGALVFLSDHPATGDRIAHLQRYIAEHRLGGTALNEAPYRSIKQRVLAHVSAPSARTGAPPAPPAAPPPPPGAPGAPPAPSAPPSPGGAPPPPPPR
jgi:predicted Zn-dependent protease